MKIALFEGYQERGRAILAARRGLYHQQGYGLIGCGEFDALMDRLKLLLEQAETLGITDSNAYIAAKAYYDEKSSWSGGYWVLLGSHCTAQVTELNDRIKVLTAAMMSQGVAPVVEGPAIVAPEETDYSSLAKWIVGGAIAIAGAVVTVQLVKGVSLFKKARSK